jgi:hypothetical protein
MREFKPLPLFHVGSLQVQDLGLDFEICGRPGASMLNWPDANATAAGRIADRTGVGILCLYQDKRRTEDICDIERGISV